MLLTKTFSRKQNNNTECFKPYSVRQFAFVPQSNLSVVALYPNTKTKTLTSNEMCDLPSLYDRRDTLTTKLFEEICCDPNHKLRHLLPEVNRSSVNLRNRRKFNLPICKTNRLKNCFIFSTSGKINLLNE